MTKSMSDHCIKETDKQNPDDTLLLLIIKARKADIMKKYSSEKLLQHTKTFYKNNTLSPALFATQIKLNMDQQELSR